MKTFITTLIFISVLISGSLRRSYAQDMHVVFLNPGSADDIGVWRMVSNFMQAAADDLMIDLEVLYADRNHIKMLDQAEKVAARPTQPDYVVMVNEKLVGKRMLLSFEKSTSQIIFIHNGLTDEQRVEVGNERERVKNWIGTITTDDYRAGYKLIKELFRLSPDEQNVLGITGTQATPASIIRLEGVNAYMAEAAKGRHLQVVYGEWSEDAGRAKGSMLLKRHENANIIWAANDSMALGAYDAAARLKRNNVLVGGLGGFPKALQSIKDGGMKVTVAGHPMIGAWALVLVHDYHSGMDFKDDIGTNHVVDHLAVINTVESAELYKHLVIDSPEQIDFRQFSKVLNRELKTYNFSYEHVVKAAR